MKRKPIISFIAVITCLSVFGGGALLPTTERNSTEIEPSVLIQEDYAERTPRAIAGNSWGGIEEGSTQTNPPNGKGKGRRSG